MIAYSAGAVEKMCIRDRLYIEGEYDFTGIARRDHTEQTMLLRFLRWMAGYVLFIGCLLYTSQPPGIFLGAFLF